MHREDKKAQSSTKKNPNPAQHALAFLILWNRIMNMNKEAIRICA